MKNTIKKTLFFFVTGLAFSSGALTVRFENITLEHGLSQSIINVIHKDSKGFMWFGTEDGLNKYNGYSFQVYKHDPFDYHRVEDVFKRNADQSAQQVIDRLVEAGRQWRPHANPNDDVTFVVIKIKEQQAE